MSIGAGTHGVALRSIRLSQGSATPCVAGACQAGTIHHAATARIAGTAWMKKIRLLTL